MLNDCPKRFFIQATRWARQTIGNCNWLCQPLPFGHTLFLYWNDTGQSLWCGLQFLVIKTTWIRGYFESQWLYTVTHCCDTGRIALIADSGQRVVCYDVLAELGHSVGGVSVFILLSGTVRPSYTAFYWRGNCLITIRQLITWRLDCPPGND